MRKYIAVVIAFCLAGCVTASQPNQKGEGTGHVGDRTFERSELSDDVIVFTGKTQKLMVHHKDMKFSEECPKVRLDLLDGTLLDSLELCEVKIPEYIVFDARKDFAYIDFANYKTRNMVLTYDLDLSVSKGGAMMVHCSVAISKGELVNQGCEKQGE